MKDRLPLQIEAVEARYPLSSLSWKQKSKVALSDFSLTLNRGEIFALLGPNGSGKTTTFKMILGFLKPRKGEIRVQGELAGSRKAREQIGYLPENPYFPRYLSGREVLETYGRLSGLSGKFLKDRIEMLIDLVQIRDFCENRLETYSKGMIQRVSLGQALIHDPQLLLLDEPTTGLDPFGVRVMRETMLQLKAMGKTILFTSHLLEQVETLSDRIAILYQGRKLIEGTMVELSQKNKTALIQTQGLSSDHHAEVIQTLKQWGATEVEIREGAGTLESLFWRHLS